MKKIIIWAVIIFAVIGVYSFATRSNGNPLNLDTSGKMYLLQVATSSDYGAHLVSSTGMTLYTYANDVMGMSLCVDQCAASRPPYLISASEPLAVDAAIEGQISILKRADGTTQATYRGQPLYLAKNDKRPSDVTGYDANGLWFVVKP